jgi:hypothetical protein
MMYRKKFVGRETSFLLSKFKVHFTEGAIRVLIRIFTKGSNHVVPNTMIFFANDLSNTVE